jgi:phosphomevalonate kinase
MIEPPTQTKLLDELLDCFTPEEVWYAGVPGAGGDDAIFAIGNPKIDLRRLMAERFTAQRPWLAVLPVEILSDGGL